MSAIPAENSSSPSQPSSPSTPEVSEALATSTPSPDECGLCRDLKINPTTLACGHSFCLVCLEDLKNYRKRQWARRCPLCRHPIPSLTDDINGNGDDISVGEDDYEDSDSSSWYAEDDSDVTEDSDDYYQDSGSLEYFSEAEPEEITSQNTTN